MQENRSYVTQLWANTLGGLGHHYMPHAGENHAHSTSFTRHATQIDQMHTKCSDGRQLRDWVHARGPHILVYMLAGYQSTL